MARTQTRGRGAKEMRQKDANLRNAMWASLTPEQQIARLDKRLGTGVGAKRQREKLSHG